jgi:cold shock CspA family protein
MTGTIKTLHANGFGFIHADADGLEYFFHHTCCSTLFELLEEGQKVVFDSAPSNGKGPRADHVAAVA